MPVPDVLTVLRKWLPYTVLGGTGDADSTCPTLSALLKHPGLTEMANNEDVRPVLGAARMLSDDSLLPDDHMFTAFLKTGLVKDMLFLYNERDRTSHLVIELGADVCGHAKVLHGGLLSSICDETYGALVYSMKHAKVLGSEPAVTANLNVNFRQPVPTQSCVHCTAKLTKREGRKLFMEASIRDMDSNELYVDSTALFINMKPNNDSIVKASKGGPLGQMALQTDVSKWNDGPRYDSVCKEIGL